MSRRPTITVVLDGYSSLVRGYGSRDMVQAVTGRPPTYSSVRKGWSCQEDTARDVIAVAEARNCDIVITGGRSPRSGSGRGDLDQVVGVESDQVVGDRLW